MISPHSGQPGHRRPIRRSPHEYSTRDSRAFTRSEIFSMNSRKFYVTSGMFTAGRVTNSKLWRGFLFCCCPNKRGGNIYWWMGDSCNKQPGIATASLLWRLRFWGERYILKWRLKFYLVCICSVYTNKGICLSFVAGDGEFKLFIKLYWTFSITKREKQVFDVCVITKTLHWGKYIGSDKISHTF